MEVHLERLLLLSSSWLLALSSNAQISGVACRSCFQFCDSLIITAPPKGAPLLSDVSDCNSTSLSGS